MLTDKVSVKYLRTFRTLTPAVHRLREKEPQTKSAKTKIILET